MENSNIEGVTTDGKRKHSKFKYCIVPQCPSTTIKWPDKLFISLPRNPNTRNLWQKAMKREVFLGPKTNKYVCEDHFNLEEDLANYQYYKLMGKGSGYVKIKPEIVPHIFHCQKDTVVKSTPSRGPIEKGKRRENVSKATKEHEKNTKMEEQDAEKLGSQSNADILKKRAVASTTKNKCVQVNIKTKTMSKFTQSTQT